MFGGSAGVCISVKISFDLSILVHIPEVHVYAVRQLTTCLHLVNILRHLPVLGLPPAVRPSVVHPDDCRERRRDQKANDQGDLRRLVSGRILRLKRLRTDDATDGKCGIQTSGDECTLRVSGGVGRDPLVAKRRRSYDEVDEVDPSKTSGLRMVHEAHQSSTDNRKDRGNGDDSPARPGTASNLSTKDTRSNCDNP